MKIFILFIALIFSQSIYYSQITLSETHQNPTCFGFSNGSTTVTAIGGTGPYTYSWSPTNTNSPIITGITSGQYTVVVNDAASSSSSLVVNILQPNQLNAVTSLSFASCFGQCNSSINITPSGGIAPYTYSLSNVAVSNPIINLCDGTYILKTKDANNCQTTNTIIIPRASLIGVTTSKKDASCGNSCNGLLYETIYPDTATGIIYNWSNGSTKYYANNLCAGSYTVQITDRYGCTLTGSGTINSSSTAAIPNATATSSVYNETCFGSNDGIIDISLSGSNTGPFTYQWQNGYTTQDIANCYAGYLYWVTISDGSSNCIFISDTISTTGTNCGKITGNVFIDNNTNCNFDSGDNYFAGAKVVINPGNKITFANSQGNFSANDLNFGTYSVSINTANNSNLIATCVTTLAATINSISPISINNALSASFNTITQPDMKVTSWSDGIVPGFACRMDYKLQNLNNVNGSGFFKVTLPPSFIINLISGFPSGYSISGDTLIWSFSNIKYSTGFKSFFAVFTTPLNTPLGSMFSSCAYAKTTVTDYDLANNTNCYQRIVTGSFDPNDKTVSPVGVGTNGEIAASVTDLTYLIRFQNTGNGPAVNIMVKDTLSPNVNINTFEMLSSSHNYNIDILDGNILRWKFNNIMLADSNSNEPASHGYIQYRIKRTNNNTPGTQIKNTAYIYFDFNDPVVTNTAINTIETISGIKSQSSTDNEWYVYPNPSIGIIYLINNSSQQENKTQIQVVNSIGQVVYSDVTSTTNKTVDLSKLNNGVYFVKLVSDKQNVIKRIVLSK